LTIYLASNISQLLPMDWASNYFVSGSWWGRQLPVLCSLKGNACGHSQRLLACSRDWIKISANLPISESWSNQILVRSLRVTKSKPLVKRCVVWTRV
jgi:hypothetical protein